MTDPDKRDPNASEPVTGTEPEHAERADVPDHPGAEATGADTAPAATSDPPAVPGDAATDPSTRADEPVVEPAGGEERANNAADHFSETSSKPADPPRSSVTPQAAPRGRGLLAVVTVLVLLLIGFGVAGGYQGWRFYQQTQATLAEREQTVTRQETALAAQQRSLERLESDLAELGQGQDDLRQTVGGVRDRVQATLGEVEQTRNEIQRTQSDIKETQANMEETQANMAARLDAQQARINSLGNTSREDWMLAEAEYLLRLANQRVLLERSPANAIALLSAADAIVREVAAGMGDPELFAIRKAIGRELTQLKLVPDLDREGTFLQLQALADTVTDLPRVPESRFGETSSADELLELSDEGDQPWYTQLWRALKDAGGALSQYVRIEDATGPGEPLLGQREALLVATNVRLLLSQAQLALLRDEPAIYQQSLEQASELVRTRYIDSTERDAWIAELRAQAGKDISAPMPDISNSVKLLHGFIEKLHAVDGE